MKFFIIPLSLLIGLLTGFFIAFVQTPSQEILLYPHGLQSKAFFDTAYNTATSPSSHTTDTHALISAHHLLVANEIASLFESVSSPVNTVVLLSPNHFSNGYAPIQLSYGNWQTPYGTLFSNTSATHALLDHLPTARIEESTFEFEHGIAALTPFIKRSFPNAQLVPIVLSPDLEQSAIDKLAGVIATELPNALVIASADMSHELPSSVATFHDSITLSAIEAGYSTHSRLEIDAQPILETLFALNQLRGEQAWNLTYHGNSLEMNATTDVSENVSHILGYFTKGDPVRTTPLVSLMFVGDLMFDRFVESQIAQNGIDYPLEKMTRFLTGTDETIGNLEGTIGEQPEQTALEDDLQFAFSPAIIPSLAESFTTLGLINNHANDYGQEGYQQTRTYLQEADLNTIGGSTQSALYYKTHIDGFPVVVIGYNAFSSSIDAVTEILNKQNSNEDQLLIVFAHWGDEYLNEATPQQKEAARAFVEAGADLIIGHHPHVIGGIEFIENTPVVYSLGNFVFDQVLPGTNEGIALGVSVNQQTKELTLSFLPYVIERAQPRPPTRAEEQALLDELSSLSQISLKQAILNGILTIIYE